MSDVKRRYSIRCFLFPLMTRGKKKRGSSEGADKVIEGINGGGKSGTQQRQWGTAFSTVILEVYEVCRNRISLYGRGRPLAICSRVDATPTSSTTKARALPETGCRIEFEQLLNAEEFTVSAAQQKRRNLFKKKIKFVCKIIFYVSYC